jgi:hypothetical protein
MKAQGAMIQGGLAALGLLVAYTTWQREPERPPGESMVLDVTQNDLSKLRFEDGAGKWVELDRRKDGEGPVVWLKMSGKADAKVPEREVRGSEGALKLWGRFAPLQAARSLGALNAAKLKELGLDAPKKKLEVTARGEKHVFLVGTSPFGVSQPYVKDEHDGKVYVFESGLVSDLESAPQRLVDRQLHTWKPQDYDALTITAGTKKRELVQLNPDTPQSAKLAAKAKPDKPDDLAKNWHDKVWRMMVVDVLGKGETPVTGAPNTVLRVDYRFHGKDRGFIEIGRVAPPQPPPVASTPHPPVTPPVEIYAKTENTAGWVKLAANVDDLLKEAEKVAAGE